MILTLVPLLFTGIASYYLYNKFVSKQLDCPANNQVVKGLEKTEIKAAVKEADTQKKALEKEIKEIEKERKGCVDKFLDWCKKVEEKNPKEEKC